MIQPPLFILYFTHFSAPLRPSREMNLRVQGANISLCSIANFA